MHSTIFKYIFISLLTIISFNTANSKEIWERTGTFDGEKSGVVLSIGTSKNGNVFACVNTGAPVFQSTNSGKSWQKSTLPSNNYINDFATKDTMMFAASLNGIFRSFDNGLTWKLSNSGLTTLNIKSIIVTSNGILFAGTRGNGIFRSNNNGDTWIPSNKGLSNLKINAIVSLDSNNLIVATDGEGLFFTKNGGSTWEAGSSEVRLNYVLTLAISPKGYLYAGTDNYGVFRTKNMGNSWEEMMADITGKVNYISITPNNKIYVGTFEKGIFYSSDDGNTWTVENEGIDNEPIAVYCLAIAPNGDVYAGTGGGGVYRRTIVNGINDEKDFTITNFNIRTTNKNNIYTTFSVRSRGLINCTLYSVLGERITELINETFVEGKYDIEVNSNSALSSLHGIYYCRFTTSNFNQTKLIYFP
ncbi:MAG: hypothetical protein JST20_09615 [Bacteroidetes bacterium]|nr:hypothetical protein [Bacteroidota bacterium]